MLVLVVRARCVDLEERNETCECVHHWYIMAVRHLFFGLSLAR